MRARERLPQAPSSRTSLACPCKRLLHDEVAVGLIVTQLFGAHPICRLRQSEDPVSLFRPALRSRYQSAWWRGVALGILVWGITAFGAFAIEALEPNFPEWSKQLDLPDTLGSICAVAAAPVTLGGWLLIWGDAGPPFPWIHSWVFVITFGISSYGLLGGLIGLLTAFMRRQS